MRAGCSRRKLHRDETGIGDKLCTAVELLKVSGDRHAGDQKLLPLIAEDTDPIKLRGEKGLDAKIKLGWCGRGRVLCGTGQLGSQRRRGSQNIHFQRVCSKARNCGGERDLDGAAISGPKHGTIVGLSKISARGEGSDLGTPLDAGNSYRLHKKCRRSNECRWKLYAGRSQTS